MRVLVTGGTGFLASRLVPALQERGHQVSALVLPAEDDSSLRFRGVEVRTGDVREATSLVPAMAGIDAVIHLAAAIGVRRPLDYYHAVNVVGTENVCRVAVASGVGRLIYVSTTSVYQQGAGTPATEAWPAAPLPDPYPVTKAAAERGIQRMIGSEGLSASIVRTSTVYGPEDRLNFGRIAGRLLSGRGLVIGSGRNRVPFTHIDDVVRGLLLVLTHERANGETYNIADDRCPTQMELLEEIAHQLGVGTPRLHIPYPLAYAAAFAAEGLAKVTRSPHPVVTRFGIALYGADNRVAIDKARRELGYEPRVALQDGIRQAVAWYRERVSAGVATRHDAAPVGGVGR